MRLMALLYVCCLTILISCSTTFAYDNRPIIILREDDARAACRDIFPEFENKSFLEYGKQLRIPITWAVITNQTTSGANGALSWAELIDYVTNAGGELASHSASHAPMPSLQAYVDDLLLSKAAIQANTPYTCNTFLQPGTWTGDAFFNTYAKMDNILGQAIQNPDNFQQSQLYLPFERLGIGPPILKHGLQVNYAIDYNNRPVKEDLFRSIDYMSKIPGVIFVIAFHGIQSSTGNLDYHVRADFMAALLIKLTDLREAGLIRIESINDAYNNNQFSPDVNRVFDSGFEVYDSGLSQYLTVWTIKDGDTVVDQAGYNSPKCCRIVPGGDLHQTLYVQSGRYKLTWMQKVDNPAIQNSILKPLIIATNVTNNIQSNAVSYPSYKNTSNEWEEKSVFLKIPDKANKIYARFYCTDAFLVDNISIQRIDTDPNECVSGFRVTPVPTGMILRWRAPDNSSYNKIDLRYSTSQMSPQTISEGTPIQQLDAHNGNNQTFFYPFDWRNKNYVYCSAFAFNEVDNIYSAPDVDYLMVDPSKPSVTINPITRQNNVVNITWKSTANASSIFTNHYAIGSASNTTDIIGWTEDQDCSVQLNSLQSGKRYYLSVKSQNVFGVESDVASLSFTTEASDIADVFEKPNGSTVIATGYVSAIYHDFYYIQNLNRIKGIRVDGAIDSSALGTKVTVEGILDKNDAGERFISIGSPTP